MIVHVQDEVLAHNGQANEADVATCVLHFSVPINLLGFREVLPGLNLLQRCLD
jgi:hypothetical protein